MKPIIEVKNLSKKYRLGETQPYYTLRDSLMEFIKNPVRVARSQLSKDEFWALKDINFSVNQGEVVGIIGKNGAGKSTLLKILSQITPPTEGEVILRGRVGSLLEVGTGFSPELTGRENIYLNGAVLGMKKSEVKSKFDEIVDFAEVEKFLDTPLKRYSSGMYMRLAFAVAAHLEPEILIVDEVLAVGDAEFQKKCLGKMGEVAGEGRTVLFVSHNMDAIKSLTKKSILIEGGNLKHYDETKKVVTHYFSSAEFEEAKSNPSKRINIPSNAGPKISSVSILDKNMKKSLSILTDETMYVKLKITHKYSEKINKFSVVWFLQDEQKQNIAVGSSGSFDNKFFDNETTEVLFSIKPISLLKGEYSFRFVLHISGENSFDNWESAIFFNILSPRKVNGGASYPHVWEVKQYIENEWLN